MPRPVVRLDPHAAELGVTISADTVEELFAEAARWLARQIGGSGPLGAPTGEWTTVHVEAPDRATLLVEWFNELIGRSEIEGAAFHDVRHLRMSDRRLDAEIRATAVRDFRLAIKAATLHGATVAQERGRWRGEVLLDV